MLRTLFRGSLWAVLGLGAVLMLLLSVRAQTQPPVLLPSPVPGKAQRPAADQDIAALRQAEADLRVKVAELESKYGEVRLAEERVKQAKARLDRAKANFPPVVPEGERALPAALEQRLQRLEHRFEVLHKMLEDVSKHLAGQRAADRKSAFIDLQSKANQKCKEEFHSGRYPGNTLASLPTGEQTFLGVKFQIGEGVVQLGSASIADKPEKVEGIKVGSKCRKLHILHATGYYLDEGEEARIGAYTIHYGDGTSATIPIVYGQDVKDWWKYPGASDPTRGKVAWEGVNEASKGFEATLRLYLTTWDNPHPEKTVTSIDYASTMDTPCAPFCVAITMEEP